MFGLVPFKMNKDLNNSNTMFNDLFGDFFNDNLNMNTAIKADIRETKEAYILEADLPGMRKEDINLEYNQNYLTIHAHKNETIIINTGNNRMMAEDTLNILEEFKEEYPQYFEVKEDKKENYIRKERHYGEVSRSFYVGNIDKSAISAKFENGVLEVTLPKQEKSINEDNKIKIE